MGTTKPVEVTLSTELKVDGDLLAEDVKPWVNALPNGAKIKPKMRQAGDQRDPYEVCVGLRAEWTEQRGASSPLPGHGHVGHSGGNCR